MYSKRPAIIMRVLELEKRSAHSLKILSCLTMASNSQLTIFSLLLCHPCLIFFFLKHMVKALKSLILCQIWIKMASEVKSLLEQEMNRQRDHINLFFKGQHEKIHHLKCKSHFLSVLKGILIHLGKKRKLSWSIHYILFYKNRN